MELPITRPSKISYAKDLNFNELLWDLKSGKYNGFIRVTSDSKEGYILLSEGKQIAASYDKYSKINAIEKIKITTNEDNTLIEVFDLRKSQIDYLTDVNKAYLIDSSSENIVAELKKVRSNIKTKIEQSSLNDENSEVKTVKIEYEVPNISEEPNINDIMAELKKTRSNAETETKEPLFKDENSEVKPIEVDYEVPNIHKEIKLPSNENENTETKPPEAEYKIPNIPEIKQPSLNDENSEVKTVKIEYEVPNISEEPNINDIMAELKKARSNAKTETKEPLFRDENSEVKPVEVEYEVPNTRQKIKSKNTTRSVRDKLKAIAEARAELKSDETHQEAETKIEYINILQNNVEKIEELEPNFIAQNKETNINTSRKIEVEKPEYSETEFIESNIGSEDINRIELMKKYGLKDTDEEEVDDILENYQGGSLSDEDAEKIELTLMNKIKKSILGIPKIKGAEVMVFLDNTNGLTGTINIITDYESGGFLSKIMGESRNIRNLERHIINITQIEIKKSFREYPEIVDYFEINVEI